MAEPIFEVFYWIFTKEGGLRIGSNEIEAPTAARAMAIMAKRLKDVFGDVLHVIELD